MHVELSEQPISCFCRSRPMRSCTSEVPSTSRRSSRPRSVITCSLMVRATGRRASLEALIPMTTIRDFAAAGATSSSERTRPDFQSTRHCGRAGVTRLPSSAPRSHVARQAIKSGHNASPMAFAKETAASRSLFTFARQMTRSLHVGTPSQDVD